VARPSEIPLSSRVAGHLSIGVTRAVFRFAGLIGPDRSSDLGGFLARNLGSLLPVHRTAIANLRAAFPDKDDREIRRIARAAWDNLGRTGAEYPHLDVLVDYDFEHPKPNGRIEVSGVEQFFALRDDGRPGIVFSAHLANWELPAIIAARYGLEATAVFRLPNNPTAARLVAEVRSKTMCNLAASRPGVVFALQGILERGGHIGALVDQHLSRGVVTPFMGRPALTNPLLGMLARHFDCPVHGVRVIRLPKHRFRLELTPPLDLPRDAEGRIDVQGAMCAITATVEAWVREHPGQWLWMHRRWRPIRAPQGDEVRPDQVT
jgi:KDO2-lipid IV(A) lauroyltransferase